MRFWFGRKSAAPDARPFVPAWLGGEAHSGFARSYDSQFEEVFRRNPVGQRAVRLVAGMLGALPIYSAEGDERAAALASSDGLLEGIAANLLLHGNAYAQLISGDDGAPAEIFTLRPERVSIVSDERGWPTAYLYRVAGRITRYERMDALGRRQVAHLKALHPSTKACICLMRSLQEQWRSRQGRTPLQRRWSACLTSSRVTPWASGPVKTGRSPLLHPADGGSSRPLTASPSSRRLPEPRFDIAAGRGSRSLDRDRRPFRMRLAERRWMPNRARRSRPY